MNEIRNDPSERILILTDTIPNTKTITAKTVSEINPFNNAALNTTFHETFLSTKLRKGCHDITDVTHKKKKLFSEWWSQQEWQSQLPYILQTWLAMERRRIDISSNDHFNLKLEEHSQGYMKLLTPLAASNRFLLQQITKSETKTLRMW